jgi:methylated-DNA-[protein]-cysteine S-methyltransferase
VIPSPVGPLLLTAVDAGLTGVWFAPEDDGVPGAPGGSVGPAERPGPAADAVRAAAAQLAEYFAGGRTAFDVPLAAEGTPFQRRVWAALGEIPHGRTVSYAELARRVGSPAAVRAVGGANGRNPLAIVVPCHRVVGADGLLTGFGGGVARKRWLLAHEGAWPSAPAAPASPVLSLF